MILSFSQKNEAQSQRVYVLSPDEYFSQVDSKSPIVSINMYRS